MKKILLALLSCSFLITTANANWDRVSTIPFESDVPIQVTAKWTEYNTYCKRNNFKSKNITNLLSKSNIAGEQSCNYSGGKITCNKLLDSYPNRGFIKLPIQLVASSSDIVGKRNIGGIVKINLNVQLNIMVNSNGMPSGQPFTKPFHRVVDLGTIEYQDSRECETVNTEEQTLVDADGNTYTEYVTVITPDPPVREQLSCDDCGTTVNNEISNDMAYGKIDSFFPDENQCSKGAGDTYYCYANNFLKLFVVSSDVSQLRLNINNSDNNNLSNVRTPNKIYPDLDTIILLDDFLTQAWDASGTPMCYTFALQGLSENDNFSTAGNIENLPICFVPNPVELKGIADSVIANTVPVYANNSDTYTYKVKMVDKFDNIIKNKKVTSLECYGTGCLPDINNSGGISVIGVPTESDANGIIEFSIKSAVPNSYSGANQIMVQPNFLGTVNKWNPKYLDTINTTTLEVESNYDIVYNQPITFDSLNVEGDNINVSKNQRYDLKLSNIGNANITSGRIVGIVKNNFPIEGEYSYDKFNLISNNILASNPIASFSAKILATSDDAILEDIKVNVQNLRVKYNLDSNAIDYKLRGLDGKQGCAINTTGLKIDGFSYSRGKDNKTSELNSLGDFSKAELTKHIYKNAATLTRGLDSGNKVNNVLYIDKSSDSDKTVALSSIDNLGAGDTLILRNGNLFIDENILDNVTLVVLAFAYDAKVNNGVGNIYIKNTVSQIKAYIYADGGFMSAKADGSVYSENELRVERLDLQGTLFSTNTIGGSEKGSSECILPGGIRTSDCNLAEKYDLNYIRKHIMTCGDTEDYSFSIKYDPKIQNNTPAIFLMHK